MRFSWDKKQNPYQCIYTLIWILEVVSEPSSLFYYNRSAILDRIRITIPDVRNNFGT